MLGYPAAYALGLVAPWATLLIAGALGADTGTAVDWTTPPVVVGVVMLGVYATFERRAGLRPESGDLAHYVSTVATSALALFPLPLLAVALVYEGHFPAAVFAPALWAAFGVFAAASVVELAVRLVSAHWGR